MSATIDSFHALFLVREQAPMSSRTWTGFATSEEQYADDHAGTRTQARGR